MDMKYFKSPSKEIYAYPADGSEDAFILPGLVEISSDELAEIRAAQQVGPELTPEQLIERFQVSIQVHMDVAARKAGYDDIKTAVTYADEPSVPKFEAEGKALRAWRSLIWVYGYEQIAAVQSGARSLPTPEELIAELPPLVMP